MTWNFRSMGCDVAVSRAAPDVERVFADDERRFSRFDPQSELSRVNAARGPVLVSERFARAVRAALRAWRQSNGLVDPTLLDAIEAAGYDRDFAALGAVRGAAADVARDAGARPAHRIGAARPRAAAAGSAARIRLVGRLLTTQARLDLNGVVKAMAVDDSLRVLGDGWVSAGGDIASSRPLEVELPGGGSVRLVRGGLATSGTDKRRWLRDGHVQHHLIDPRSGRPADSPWQQVTVCGATCLMADVAAKTALLMGDGGPEWLDGLGMAGRFRRGDGSIVANGVWAEAACT